MSTGFDFLLPGALDGAALLAARVGALVLIAPVFSASVLPNTLKATLVVLVTFLMLPLAFPAGARMPAFTIAAVTAESLVGFAMGLGAALVVGAAETAGDLLAVQSGLSGASTLDPLTLTTAPSLGEFFRLLVLTLLITSGGHILSLQALAASTRVIPIGSTVAVRDGLAALVGLGGQLFLLGLRFAAPVTAAVLVSNLALGVLSRTVPQLNALAVAYPVQITVGLLALLASLPLIGAFMGAWPAQYQELVARLLGTLAHGGR